MTVNHMLAGNIKPNELKELLAKGEAVVVDVREREELDVVSLSGAKHIPLNSFMDRVREIDWTKKVVLICRSGSRSLWLAHTLGPEYPALNLYGGIKSCWQTGDFARLLIKDERKVKEYFR